MKLDIDKLTEAELIDLNNRIVARLKFLSQMRAHAKMMTLRIGQRVTFTPDGHDRQFGIVAKYNRKSVTVVTESGQQWNVSPQLLQDAENPAPRNTGAASPQNVFQLPHHAKAD
jgi:hypothetical protein